MDNPLITERQLRRVLKNASLYSSRERRAEKKHQYLWPVHDAFSIL